MKRFNAFCFHFRDSVTLSIKEDMATGIAVSPYGGIQMVDDAASIKQSILMILSMVPGERLMRPDYGCDLYKLVFSPNDETTAGLAIHYIKKAVARWEPRIDILSIDAAPAPNNQAILEIFMSYKIKNTQANDQIVYSFNLEGN